MKQYQLSVLLVTYNHQHYIQQALHGLLRQEIDVDIEVVVADDASTDETLSMIKSHEGQNSRLHFKYLSSDCNLGITKNYQRGFAACSGTYVAVLEGDDYWCSPFKLKRQMDFLDTHWEANACAVNYFVYVQESQQLFPRVILNQEHRLLTARDLINDNLVGNFSVCMYRKSVFEALPKKLFELCSYDWIINICLAREGFFAFLGECMSVYRVHSNGMWSKKTHKEQVAELLIAIDDYDALTNGVFHDEFESKKVCLNQQTNKFYDIYLKYMPLLFKKMYRQLTPIKYRHAIRQRILRLYS